VPFEKVVEELQPERDLSRTPLFQVFFNLRNFADTSLKLPGLKTQNAAYHGDDSEFEESAKFDLTLYATERVEELQLVMVYNADLFAAETVTRMLVHLQNLLEAIVDCPTTSLSRIPMLTKSDRERLAIRQQNIRPDNPFVVFAKGEIEQSIATRFAAQVVLYPNNLAVKTKTHAWTYAELNDRANRVAQHLRRLEGSAADRVALLLQHDSWMVAGLLGVLKAGKTYVPLEASHPIDRLAFILQDTRPVAIVTCNTCLTLAEQLAAGVVSVINIEHLESVSADDDMNPPVPADEPAYILYTSGSSGQPKGVIQNQRNVLQHIRNYTNNLHIDSQDRLTLLSSYSFDAAVMDIFGALLNGAALYPFDVKQEGFNELGKWLADQQITIYHSTPTIYRYFVNVLQGNENLSSIRLVVLGGEEVFKRDVDCYKRNFTSNCLFINGLGPTESTLALQYFVNQASTLMGHSVPVGYPVADTEVLLLDESRAEVEPYGIGEIAIKSAHVALGYWQQAELTRKLFTTSSNDGRRIYLTGDLGRLEPDGSIRHIGRKDFQVKIRGYRVELNEIKNRLLEHPKIKDAAVVSQSESSPGESDKRLVAYLVADGTPLSGADLRRFLRQRLPEYMVPTGFYFLDHLPWTPNGKVDLLALNKQSGRIALEPAAENSTGALETELERQIAATWSKVLGVERIGRHDDFFELGGHSLLAAQVVARLRSEHGVDLPLRAFFDSPTLTELAVATLQHEAKKTDGATLNHLLAELEQLSEDEVSARLSSEGVEQEAL